MTSSFVGDAGEQCGQRRRIDSQGGTSVAVAAGKSKQRLVETLVTQLELQAVWTRARALYA